MMSITILLDKHPRSFVFVGTGVRGVIPERLSLPVNKAAEKHMGLSPKPDSGSAFI